MNQNNHIDSLLKLLDDTDSNVYKNIADEILSIGYDAIPSIQQLESTTNNSVVRKRCAYLYSKLRHLHYAAELKTWSFISNGNSWDFMYLISEYCDISFKVDNIKASLYKYEEAFFNIDLKDKTPEEISKYLQKFIFNDAKFTFSSNFLEFSNLLLSNFYTNKKGSAFLMCMFYCILAEKHHLPIYTVAFPGNLVLVYAKKENPTSQEDILFYINPSNGEIFSKKGIELFLEKYNLENKVQYYLPCSTFEVCLLYIQTLKEAYNGIGETKKAHQMQQFADIIIETIKQYNIYKHSFS